MHGEGQREKQGEGQSYINRDGEMESHKGGYRKRRGRVEAGLEEGAAGEIGADRGTEGGQGKSKVQGSGRERGKCRGR